MFSSSLSYEDKLKALQDEYNGNLQGAGGDYEITTYRLREMQSNVYSILVGYDRKQDSNAKWVNEAVTLFNSLSADIRLRESNTTPYPIPSYA